MSVFLMHWEQSRAIDGNGIAGQCMAKHLDEAIKKKKKNARLN